MEYLEVMNELRNLGTEQTKNIYINHGADLDLYGVSVANLRKIAKKIKKNHKLGIKLLNSNNIDAIYLSQWIVDASLLSISDFEKALDKTNYYMIIEYAIAPLVVKNRDISFLCLHKWIESNNHGYRQAAYTIFSLILSTYENKLIDMNYVQDRLNYVEENIHQEENRVRYAMNSFVIAVGISLPRFTKKAKKTSEKIGKVKVNMGNTSCKVPDAHKYIEKVEGMNKIGIKRKI